MAYNKSKQNNVSINEWTQKYIREYPFMPFGSMMNAWAVLNQGKDIDIESFMKVAEDLFALANKFIDKKIEDTDIKTEGEDPDIEITTSL